MGARSLSFVLSGPPAAPLELFQLSSLICALIVCQSELQATFHTPHLYQFVAAVNMNFGYIYIFLRQP